MSCNVGQVPMTWVKQRKGCRMSCDVGGASFSNSYIASPTSQLILQPFRRFTYVTAHSTSLPLLHLRHRHFTYVTAHSPTLPPLYLRHSSIYSPSGVSPTSQALHLRHNSFSNPCAALPTSQLVLQPFRCFSYVIGTSRTSPGEPPMHRGMKKQAVVDQLFTAIY